MTVLFCVCTYYDLSFLSLIFVFSLKYAAPEVKVDVWYLGLYRHFKMDICPPNNSSFSQEMIKTLQWYDWVAGWTTLFLKWLEDEDKGHMIKVNAIIRWPMNKCLALEFKNGLFKRRRVDDLVICIADSYSPIMSAKEENKGTQTPTAAVKSSSY